MIEGSKAQRFFGVGYYDYKYGKPQELEVEMDLWVSFCMGLEQIRREWERKLIPYIICLFVPFMIIYTFFNILANIDADTHKDTLEEKQWWFSTITVASFVGPFLVIHRIDKPFREQKHAAWQAHMDEVAPAFAEQGYDVQFVVCDGKCCAYPSMVYARIRQITKDPQSKT